MMALRSFAMRFLPQGEGGLVVELGDVIDPALNARVHLLAHAIRSQLAGEVDEVVPTYRSLLVLFDPLRVDRAALSERIAALEATARDEAASAEPLRVVRVPACYGADFG